MTKWTLLLFFLEINYFASWVSSDDVVDDMSFLIIACVNSATSSSCNICFTVNVLLDEFVNWVIIQYLIILWFYNLIYPSTISEYYWPSVCLCESVLFYRSMYLLYWWKYYLHIFPLHSTVFCIGYLWCHDDVLVRNNIPS